MGSPSPSGLSESAPPVDFSDAAISPLPKPRGRPPKQDTSFSEDPTDDDLEGDAKLDNVGITPKKRGRPAKSKVLDTAAEIPAGESEASDDAENPDDLDLANGSASVKRSRGRPRKVQNDVTAVVPSNGVEGAVLGQDSPAEFSVEKRGRGRPKKLTGSATPTSSGRPRGRPRKSDVAASTGDRVAIVGMKRGPGRPPKIGGSQIKAKIAGRGRGRPPKVNVWGGEILSGQSKNLRKKLEDMQQKAKETLDLLRPHGDIVDIMVAIENLEELVEMVSTD